MLLEISLKLYNRIKNNIFKIYRASRRKPKAGEHLNGPAPAQAGFKTPPQNTPFSTFLYRNLT
jgi:hypothetical protein